MTAAIEELEAELEYCFEDRALFERALTHKSRAFEESSHGGEPNANNEQLEFLGDAVLGFLVSEILVAQFPSLAEGRLSKAKASLVSADHLQVVARGLELGRYLFLGRGEELNGGRTKRALLANSLEALIAAIYLDGGYGPARRFVTERVVGDIDALREVQAEIYDFKGALQEFTQSRKLPPPRYRVVRTTGPEHSKTFTVEAAVSAAWSAQAEGLSKKSAGQQAAEILLGKLQEEEQEAGEPVSDPAG